eukprot:12027092-Karenia_brevis.AAC.1
MRQLWPIVLKEIRWAAAVLPLLSCQIDLPWNNELLATDSSPHGYGVCSQMVSNHTVAHLGSICEKSRSRFEQAMKAREHALANADAMSTLPDDDTHTLCPDP